jgi:hypothetical protein
MSEQYYGTILSVSRDHCLIVVRALEWLCPYYWRTHGGFDEQPAWVYMGREVLVSFYEGKTSQPIVEPVVWRERYVPPETAAESEAM